VLDAATIILILYAYVFAVGVAGLAYVRKSFGEPSTEPCTRCGLRGVCSKLGLNRVAPPVKYVRRVPKSFKVRFYLALGAGCAAIIVLAALTNVGSIPYLLVSLLVPAYIAKSIAKL